jgi:hypothetical protein
MLKIFFSLRAKNVSYGNSVVHGLQFTDPCFYISYYFESDADCDVKVLSICTNEYISRDTLSLISVVLLYVQKEIC